MSEYQKLFPKSSKITTPPNEYYEYIKDVMDKDWFDNNQQVHETWMAWCDAMSKCHIVLEFPHIFAFFLYHYIVNGKGLAHLMIIVSSSIYNHTTHPVGIGMEDMMEETVKLAAIMIKPHHNSTMRSYFQNTMRCIYHYFIHGALMVELDPDCQGCEPKIADPRTESLSNIFYNMSDKYKYLLSREYWEILDNTARYMEIYDNIVHGRVKSKGGVKRKK